MKRIISIITIAIVTICTSSVHAQKVIELSKKDFLEKVWNYEANPSQWKYEGSLPCLIDFNATWCGPCRMMEPILENMATKYNDKIIIYKVDVDKEQELAALFGVRSIPAFLFCPTQGEPQATTGAYPSQQFEKLIRSILLGETTE